MAFDVQGALAAGYTREEIAKDLAGKQGFNLQGALSSGYSYDDILPQLAAGRTQGEQQPASQPMIQAGMPTGASQDAWDRVPGRTLRAGVSGLTSVADLVASPVRYGMNKVNAAFGGDPNYFKPLEHVATQALDTAGVAKPANAQERFFDQGASALASAAVPVGVGQVMARGAGLLPSVAENIGATLAASPGTAAVASGTSSAAQQTAQEAGLGTGGQIVSGLLGGMAPAALASGGAALRSVLPRVNTEKLAAFGGRAPSLAHVSDSPAVQQFENALERGFGSAGVMGRARDKAQQALQSTVDESAERLAGGQYVPSGVDEMGAVARSAAEASKNRFQRTAGLFEDKVYAPVGQEPASLANTRKMIADESARFSPASAAAYEGRALSQLGPLVADDAANALNIETIRRYRGNVGERLQGAPSASPTDASQREIRGLYGSLSQDIEAAIPEALRPAVQRYNQWYAGQRQARDTVEKAFLQNQSDAGTGRRVLSAPAENLEALRDVIGGRAFDALRAGALKEMAKGGGTAGNQGQYSAQQLAQKIGKGRQALPENVQRMLLGEETPRLRAITDALNDRAKFTNTSNTATSVLQDIGYNMARPVAPILRQGAARLLTSPTAINALARIQGMQTVPAAQRMGVAAIPGGLLGLMGRN